MQDRNGLAPDQSPLILVAGDVLALIIDWGDGGFLVGVDKTDYECEHEYEDRGMVLGSSRLSLLSGFGVDKVTIGR